MLDVNFSPIANIEGEGGVSTPGYRRSKQSEDGDNVDESSGVTDSESGGNSTVLNASFNFINSIVGAGIIGIPFAVQQCGFVSGVLMLGFVAYLVYRSVTILIDCGVKANKLDFEELAEHLLGRPGYFAVLIFMFLFAYGAQIAYLVVIGDTIPIVAELFLPNSLLANRNFTIALVSIFVILPLCLLKDLSSLSWTSMLSIGADIALVLIVLIAAPSASTEEGIRHNEISILNPSVFVGIGTMSFAFVCQHNSFIVFRTLKERSVKNWERVAKGSIFFSFLMCATLGIAGYLSFLEETEGDILNNFPKTGVVVSAARVLLAFCMVFTYPMECIVTRHCLLSIVGKIQEGRLDKIFSLVKNDEHSGSSCSDSTDSPRSPHAHTHNIHNNTRNNSHGNSQEFFGGINPMTKNIPQLQLQGSRNIHDDESDLQNSKRVFHGFLKNGKSKGKKHDTKNSHLKGEKVKENDLYVLDEDDDEDEDEDENGEVSIYFGEEQGGDGGNESNGHSKIGRNGNNEEKRGRLNDIHCDSHTNNNSNNNSMETSSSMNSTANEKSEIEEKSSNKFSPYTVKERKTGTTESGSNFTEIFIQDGDDSMSEEGSVENKRRECSSAGKMIRTGREDDYNIDANANNNSKNQNEIQCNKDLSNLDSQNNGNQNQNVKSNSKLNNFEISVTKIDETVKRKFPGSGFYYQILATRFSKTIKNIFFPDKDAASRVGVTLLLWGSSVVIALLFRDLGVVQALTGALAASMLGYVLPGVLYIRTHHKEAREVLNDLFGKDDCFEIIGDSNKSNNIDTDTYINNSNSGDNNDSSNIDNNRCDDNNNNNNNRGSINNSDMHSNNMSSPSNDSEASPVNHMTGQNRSYSSETKNLVTGRERKTPYQKFVFMSRFFMPIFLIVFGCLAAIVGVTSVFYF